MGCYCDIITVLTKVSRLVDKNFYWSLQQGIASMMKVLETSIWSQVDGVGMFKQLLILRTEGTVTLQKIGQFRKFRDFWKTD